MRSPYILPFLLLMVISAAFADEEAVFVDGGSVYGDGVKIEEATAIADIVADPDAWAGKAVRVEGKVVGVCALKGCWLELESRDQARVRIKVDDGVIVFPPEAQGLWAAAEGTVEVRDLSREQYAAWQRHLAEEKGEAFDESSLGNGPYRLVQVRGTGARIDAAH